MRTAVILILLLLAGCSTSPPPEKPKPDVTVEAWYGETVRRLQTVARDAEARYRSGQGDQAASLVVGAEPDIRRVLEAPHPTLAAMEAASDIDDLYGRMLLRNKHYGWARLSFQKNASRWRYWTPKTAESERRLRQATGAIAECDRLIAAQ